MIAMENRFLVVRIDNGDECNIGSELNTLCLDGWLIAGTIPMPTYVAVTLYRMLPPADPPVPGPATNA